MARRPTINRAGLGPQGSWKPPKNGKIDPRDPVAAPGADDHYIVDRTPVLKENQRFISYTKDKRSSTQDIDAHLKHAETDPVKHLSMATTANGNGVTVHDAAAAEETEKESSELKPEQKAM